MSFASAIILTVEDLCYGFDCGVWVIHIWTEIHFYPNFYWYPQAG